MARGYCNFRKTDKFSGGLNPTWWSKGLTFWAPFDRVADPLKLHRGVGALSFTRATGATFLNPDTGLIEVVGNDVLRIEANGVLIEGQRTNLCAYSETGAQWAANTGWTKTNNSFPAPDGSTNATRIAHDGSPGGESVYPPAVTLANGVSYVACVYVKGAVGEDNNFYFNDGGSANPVHVVYTGEWQLVFTPVYFGLGAIAYFYIEGVTGSPRTLDVWGWQIEEGSFPSSYIPTTSAAVTRNADVLTFPAIAGAGTSIAKIDGVYQEIDYDTFAPTSGHVADVRKWNRTLSAPELALLLP